MHDPNRATFWEHLEDLRRMLLGCMIIVGTTLIATEQPVDEYRSPLSARYASEEMLRIFSPQMKYSTWRRLWVALAEAQQELGLDITTEQIEQMRECVDRLNLSAAEAYEKQVHHDVMAHILAYGEQCPAAKGIIHLGATSCFVTDNGDLIQMREALQLIQRKLDQVVGQLSSFALKYADLPTLAYTHLQPAQPTTVGKRACLWIQDLSLDSQELIYRLKSLPFLGVKGTTGSQASFCTLFQGSESLVESLDLKLTEKFSFQNRLIISGQTYTRKIDHQLLSFLAGFGASAHKMATDLRLLAHLKEVEEPFAENQVGSSAMPFKRNPMLSERVCGLARFLIALSENPAYTHATQWFERSLDDSSNRRLSLSEAFLTADAILELLTKLTDGLVVYPKVIQKNLSVELPFLITENILMSAVMHGGDRQEVHEKIRVHCLAAATRVKEKGLSNDLLERIAQDPAFRLSLQDLKTLVSTAKLTGRSGDQVRAYLKTIGREYRDTDARSE